MKQFGRDMVDGPMRPTAPADRIQLVDILRGWALFGILVVNMLLDFSGYGAEPSAWTGPLDQAVVTLTRTLFRFKFVSLFTLLFGLGFFLQMTRAEARGLPFVRLYLRRLFILLIIGIGHTLLYTGGTPEVLHQYAIMGALLPVFRQRQTRTILLAAALLIVLPFGVQGATTAAALRASAREAESTALALPDSVDGVDADTAKAAPESWPPRPLKELYRAGGVRDIVTYHAQVFVQQRTSPIGYVWMLQVLALFLLGLVVARRGILQNAAAHAMLLRRVAVVGFVCGLALTLALGPLAATGSLWLGLLGGLSFTVGGVLLAACYGSMIALLAETTVGRRLLTPFARVGRMALTNYLLQTLVAAAIFWDIGLGLYGSVSPAQGLLLTGGIYALQVLFSAWWLERFRFGPAEWLWRTLTYGSIQPMRGA